jgi:hypothetical protein
MSLGRSARTWLADGRWRHHDVHGGSRRKPRRKVASIFFCLGNVATGSEYLTALHTSNLRKAQDRDERIAAVAQWKAATCFSEAERVALALVEATFVPDAGNERVSDALYAQACSLHDDKALATLAFAIGQVSFFIAVALIGKPLPGRSPSESWR